MKDYFLLQYIMINRAIKEAGIHPLLAYIVGSIAFVVISEIIFLKTIFAEYLIVFICEKKGKIIRISPFHSLYTATECRQLGLANPGVKVLMVSHGAHFCRRWRIPSLPIS